MGSLAWSGFVQHNSIGRGQACLGPAAQGWMQTHVPTEPNYLPDDDRDGVCWLRKEFVVPFWRGR